MHLQELSARRGLAKFAGERFITAEPICTSSIKPTAGSESIFHHGMELAKPVGHTPNGLFGWLKLQRLD